jgi:hypothetical protein
MVVQEVVLVGHTPVMEGQAQQDKDMLVVHEHLPGEMQEQEVGVQAKLAPSVVELHKMVEMAAMVLHPPSQERVSIMVAVEVAAVTLLVGAQRLAQVGMEEAEREIMAHLQV